MTPLAEAGPVSVRTYKIADKRDAVCYTVHGIPFAWIFRQMAGNRMKFRV